MECMGCSLAVKCTLHNPIDVQYRQSESDGQIHQTSFTMDPMEFFFKIHSHVTNILIHYVINANIITM